MDLEERQLILEFLDRMKNIDKSLEQIADSVGGIDASLDSIDHEISVIGDYIYNIQKIICKERIGETLERRL